jgi:hypothetical protein
LFTDPGTFPGFLALLRSPEAAGAPVLSGGPTTGSTLTCSQGAWAADLLGAFLYRAPASFTYSWSLKGTPISGASSDTIVASSPGDYACRVTAKNQAGSTAQSSTPFTVAAPTPPPTTTLPTTPPPTTTTTTASVGNQQITLTTPAACVAPSAKPGATATSTATSKGAKLKFLTVTFYVDKGIKHSHHKTEGNKRVVVITYTPNATKHHLPATVELSLARLKSGPHTLKVTFYFKETKHNHGYKQTVTVKKTLKVTFTVC